LSPSKIYEVEPCSEPCRSLPAIWVIHEEAFRNQEIEELLLSGKPLWGSHGSDDCLATHTAESNLAKLINFLLSSALKFTCCYPIGFFKEYQGNGPCPVALGCSSKSQLAYLFCTQCLSNDNLLATSCLVIHVQLANLMSVGPFQASLSLSPCTGGLPPGPYK
jgi:hypothetical protein